jgi:ABC-type multidrug transport system ATPase subunit
MLQVDGVSKVYNGTAWALRDVSFALDSGVLGLVGPNGAGKSTLMRILASLTKPTEGRVVWEGTDIGRDPGALRSVLGYLPQDFGVYPQLSAVEFLGYLAALKGLDARTARKRIDRLIQVLGLSSVCRRPLGSYSGGMRQRVGIAQALLNSPRLLIVDEPTAGLDPEERVVFRNLLSDLSGDRTIVLSTHIVFDIEAVATEIAILSDGRLIWHSEPEALLSTVEGRVWQVVVPSARAPDIRQRHLVCGAAHRSDGVQVRLVAEALPALDARRVPPTLEDAYLFCIARYREQGKT